MKCSVTPVRTFSRKEGIVWIRIRLEYVSGTEALERSRTTRSTNHEFEDAQLK